jgi:RNA ligase
MSHNAPTVAPSDTEVASPERSVTRAPEPFRGSQVDIDGLQALREKGLLKSARHPEFDLVIWNYSEHCQYKRLWSPVTMACRGLITDFEGNVVARPFGKFFNLGEPACPKVPAGEPFEVTEKMDGSLGIGYKGPDGEWYVASRGSFESEQAEEGTRLLRQGGYHWDFPDDATPLFEIIYPENRIVVDYWDRRDLILLASIDNYTGRDRELLPVWDGPHVHRFVEHEVLSPAELATKAVRPGREGYVLHWRDHGLRVKVKFDEYLRLHRIVSGLTEHRIWEALKNGADLTRLEGLPDETFSFIDQTSRRILTEREGLFATAYDAVSKAEALPTRKEQAEFFFRSDANPNLCFTMLDGKDVTKQLWKLTEPRKTEADDA